MRSKIMGNFSQTMDVKGRMSFPQKLRDIIGDKFIVTKGLDGCLFVYSQEMFDVICDKLEELPSIRARQILRMIISWAIEVEADKQGRILIPLNLREQAGLEKDIVVAGVIDRCEIWDKARWKEINDDMNNNDEVIRVLESAGSSL